MLFSIMTSDSIIDALGGTGAVAEALGQSDSTVSSWRLRGIPAAHWSSVVSLAAEHNVADVTLELLAELAARKSETVFDEARP